MIRSTDSVQVVFHVGAKVRDNSTRGVTIADPSALLEWHEKERCSARFYSLSDLKAKEAALRAIVTQWIEQM